MDFLEYIKLKIKTHKFFSKYFKEYYQRLRISSFPFISGDTFLALADCAVIRDYPKPIYLTDPNNKESIFIEVDLMKIESIFNLACTYKKVILHNSDTQPSKKLIEKLVKNNIYVFGTNIDYINDYVKPIPIGLENAHHKLNGNLNYYNPIDFFKVNKQKKNLLLVSFSINNLVRSKYIEILEKHNIQNLINLDLSIYRKLLAESYFVLSPPGNGIDCHRTWEAFYNNTIPVIEKKYYLFSHLDLPVYIVDDINDFLTLSDNDRINIYESIIKKNKDQIYMKWWINYLDN